MPTTAADQHRDAEVYEEMHFMVKNSRLPKAGLIQ